MSQTITVINGHPDPSPDRLCHALAEAYATGAETAGRQVNRITVGALTFPLINSKADFETGNVPPDISAAQASIGTSNHLVIVHPLWLGGMPAMLKGFLEQVFRPTFAFEDTQGAWPTGKLSDMSARVVITMGMPTLAYRWYYGAHSLKLLEQHILTFAGIKPVRETLYGMVDTASEAKRANWLSDQRMLGSKGR
ncbi:MAG: NAD(P)H-dependent oxidoreductase [Pseudomonadota bacterium]